MGAACCAHTTAAATIAGFVLGIPWEEFSLAQWVVVRKSGNCRGTICRASSAPVNRAPTRLFPYSRIIVLRGTHETPENDAQRLERAGGRNLFGEPNYRAVWGWDRLAWIR